MFLSEVKIGLTDRISFYIQKKKTFTSTLEDSKLMKSAVELLIDSVTFVSSENFAKLDKVLVSHPSVSFCFISSSSLFSGNLNVFQRFQRELIIPFFDATEEKLFTAFLTLI